MNTPRPSPQRTSRRRRHQSIGRWALQIGSFAVAVGFVAVTAVDPYAGAVASAHFTVQLENYQPPQSLIIASGQFQNAAQRDEYTTKEAPPPPAPEPAKSGKGSGSPAPSAAVPDPGTARAIGYKKVKERGWSDSEWDCLDALFSRESGWRVNAYNPSGAYGIPQALPGNKMSSVADDWQTNPATQIEWGLGYITGRYSTPCGAWAHSESSNWY